MCVCKLVNLRLTGRVQVHKANKHMMIVVSAAKGAPIRVFDNYYHHPANLVDWLEKRRKRITLAKHKKE